MINHDSGNNITPAIRQAPTTLHTLFESTNDGILIFEDTTIVDCNQRILENFGRNRDEIIGSSPVEWSPALQSGGIASQETMQEKLSAVRQGQAQFFEWSHLRKDGSLLFVDVSLYLIGSASSRKSLAILRDITNSKQIQADLQSNHNRLKAAHMELISLYQQLAASDEAIEQQLTELKASEKKLESVEHRYQLAMDASNDAIWEVDIPTDELTFSAQWLDRFGLPTNVRFQRSRWLDRVHPEDRPKIRAAFANHLIKKTPQYDLEYRARTVDGEYLWLHARGKALLDEAGSPERVVGALTDISERKQRDEQIYRTAYYDQLTHLPNRHFLEQMLQEKSLPDNAEGALLFIDLDNFKRINDSAGHACGDELIATAAGQLAAAVGPTHILARVGGDEFIVVLIGIAQRTFIDAYAQRLINLFQSPFSCRGHQFYLSASIGIALFPENGMTLEALLKNADNALHRAKESGRSSYRFFEQFMQDSLLEKIAIENQLRTCMRTKTTFQMHYQPQMNTKTGRIVGMEALMRWCCPERGEVSPLQFITAAEEIGLIDELGDWGLRTACRFCKSLHDSGHSDVCVSVNVSVKQLAQDNYVETVAAALMETGLPPTSLELEITESMLIHDFESKVKKLGALRAMGIRTALDDFGTGYSSLTYLQQLPIHTLKIDQSFVSRMSTEESTRIIIESIIALAHRLGIIVIAEGIKSKEQEDLLKKYDCDIIQGYHVGRPLAPAEMADWLASLQQRE